MTIPIRVLVVDDSAFIRKIISNMLASDPRISIVGTARNGDEALAQVKALKPDVMTLDIEMPGMNGLEVLRQVMAHNPLPILMVSSLTEEGAKETLMALELGAVDYIPKHLQGSVVNIVTIQQDLIGPISQFLTGLFPAIFGGNMEDVKTASGYALARDQAMGRLGNNIIGRIDVKPSILERNCIIQIRNGGQKQDEDPEPCAESFHRRHFELSFI